MFVTISAVNMDGEPFNLIVITVKTGAQAT